MLASLILFPHSLLFQTMTVVIQSGPNITFSGSAHMASCRLLLGTLIHEQNKALAKALTDKIGKLLQITPDK